MSVVSPIMLQIIADPTIHMKTRLKFFPNMIIIFVCYFTYLNSDYRNYRTTYIHM